MGELRVLGQKGDTRIIWNPRDPDEVAAARAQFDTLVGEKNFLAFNVTAGGGKGEQIRQFDPNAEKLIIAPPMAGGSGEEVTDTADETLRMRAMVLELARTQAIKAIKVVRSTDLDFGRVHEHVEVGDITWHVSARYWQDDDLVKIDAQPIGQQQQVPPFIAHLFGQQGVEVTAASEGGVEFSLPASWIPGADE